MFTEVVVHPDSLVFHPKINCPSIYNNNKGIYTIYPVNGVLKGKNFREMNLCRLCCKNVYEIHWTNFLVDLVELPPFRTYTWQKLIGLHMEMLATVTPGLDVESVEFMLIPFKDKVSGSINVTLSLDGQKFQSHIKFTNCNHLPNFRSKVWLSNIVMEVLPVSAFFIVNENRVKVSHYRDRCTAFVNRHLQCSGLCMSGGQWKTNNDCLVCYIFLPDDAEGDTWEWDRLQQNLVMAGDRPIVVIALRGFLHLLLNTVKVAVFPPNFQYRFVSNAELETKRFRAVVMEEIRGNKRRNH